MTEAEIGHKDAQEMELFDIEKNKCSRPEVKWLFPAAVIGAVLISVGVLLGIVIHRANTPSIYGSASGKTTTVDNDLEAFDRIAIDNDALVILSRKLDKDGGVVSLSAKGVAKEKAGKFLLKIDRSTMEYEKGSAKVLNPRGKEISAKKLLDNKIIFKKKDIRPDFIYATYKRPVNGKSKWVRVKLSREDTPVKASAPTPIWDFNLYNDLSGAFILRYPNYLTINIASPGAVHLESKEKGVKLYASAFGGSVITGLSSIYQDELKKRSQSGSVLYKLLKDGQFFVISGKDDNGDIFYLRESLVDGKIYSIETSYPETQKADGEAIIKSFPSFPLMNIVRLSGELVQSSSYPVMFKLTISEDGTVSGYYWYTKYKESNHIDLSGKVSDDIPRTLTLVSGKGTEEWLFTSNSTGPMSFNSDLKGRMLKYENNESRLAGASPTKEYSFVLR